MTCDIKKHKTIIIIIGLFSLFEAVVLCLNPSYKQYYDSWFYWEVGKGFVNGNFDLFRGYFFPAILGAFSLMGDAGSFAWYVFSSLCLAMLFTFGIKRLWGERNKSWVSIIVAVVFIIFFYGLFVYSLSDVWAFALAVLAFVCYEKIFSDKSLFYCFFMGVSSYLSYNIRTIYLFFGIGLLVLYLISEIKEKSLKKSLVRMLFVLIGFIVASAPQFYLNVKYLSKYSLGVPTNNLFGAQLLWGLQYQRYDTYIGTQVDVLQVYYIDAVGQNILNTEGITNVLSVGEYLKLFIKYPIEFVGIYTRHFVNMLLPCWPEQYIKDFDNFKVFYMFMSYTLFFLFAVVILRKMIINKNIQCKLSVLLLPVLAITPGAVEVRFYLPLYLYVVGTLCYNTKIRLLKDDICKYKQQYLVSYIFVFALMISIWTSMLASYPFEYSIFAE